MRNRRDDAHEHVRQCYSLVGTEIGLHLQVVSVWYVGDSPHLASIAIDKTFASTSSHMNILVEGTKRAREQARSSKTVKARVWSADQHGSDRRLRACCPWSMGGQLGRGRYRLGRRPVCLRDGAARRWAQCTVRPAQAGAAEEWLSVSAARRDQVG